MVAHRVDSSCMYYPSEWGESRFRLGQIVRYRGDLAFVNGLNYLVPETYFVEVEDFSPGWYVEITFLTGEWSKFYESVGHHETCIQEIVDSDLAPLLGNQLAHLPSFVQNHLADVLGVSHG